MKFPERVVVIGGGIFGASSAAELARRGITTTWVTDGRLADGASGRSLAWLNSAGLRSEAYHRIRVEGISRWRDFANRVPGSESFLRFDGGLTWAKPGESHKERFRHERALDYPSAWVPRDSIAEVVPMVDPAAVAAEGAIFNANDGWVDLPSVISVLRREFETLGGTVIEDAGRCVPVVDDGKATSVRTGADDILPADAVVVAAGPQSPGVLRDIDVTISNDSPAAFVAFTKPLDHGLTTVLNTPLVAIRPTVDGGLAMDSGWSERSITVNDDGSMHVEDQVIERLLAEATQVLAEHPTLEIDHIGMGYKPIPGDGEPCIGAIDAVDGLFVAFSHSGATQGLLMGALIAAEVTDGTVDPLTKPFRPGRITA